MVKVKVKKIEPSKYNNGSYLAFFDFNEREVYSIINNNVLKYLNVKEIRVGDELQVIKSFSKKGKAVYLIKNVEK